MKLLIDGKYMTGLFAFYVDAILSLKEYYQEYLQGKLDSAQFYKAMLEDVELARVPGFGKYSMERISLTPINDRLPLETMMEYLVNNDILPVQKNIYEGFKEYREYIRKNYNHGDFFTCIAPEDERFLYVLAKIKQPKRVFVAGAYYGYFAIWAMPFIKENNGNCVLSDIDEEVCKLAKKNFINLGYGDNVEVYNEDSAILLEKRTEPIDMLILDATGRHDDPRPEYRGKRIYGTFLQKAKHLLSKGSFIIIHNMEPKNSDMKVLVDELQSLNALGTSYETFNGLGVYIMV